ncbi:MAG: hypothetical protein JWO63_2274 [Frankiales bacterium]|nr:hypothetical protein [Frankiales bacterium]
MPEIGRRTLLSGSVLLVAAVAGAGLGLEKSVHHKVAVPPPPPPSALTAVLAQQRRLLAGYDTVAADQPARAAILSALRADVAAQSAAVEAVLQRYPGWRLSQQDAPGASPTGSASPDAAPSASAGNPLASLTELSAAVRSSVASVSQACLSWPATEPNGAVVVPLLGSIAAGLSTHLVELT